MDRDTSIWVASITQNDPTLRGKLEAVGLLEPLEPVEQCPTVSDYIDSYLKRMTDGKKPATIVNWGQAGRNLKEYLPKGIRLNEVTAGHAKQFHEKLKGKGLASTTIRKRIQVARQIFEDALDWDIIESNPFRKVEAKSHRNKSNSFVESDTILKLMKHVDPTWQTILALCRFGGLRCPSEVLSIRWVDIDWESSTMSVPEPKVEHHEGRGVRSCPIFAELRPYLEKAWELAPEGSEYVVDKPAYRNAANSGQGWKNANLRTQLLKKLRKAGIPPWARLFHSLRASRQTELEREFPLHVVCAWLGNTPEVARQNYLLVTDGDVERAIQGNAECNAVEFDTSEKSNAKCNAANCGNEQQQQATDLAKTLGKYGFQSENREEISGHSGSRTPTPCGTRS
ncbi:MAG: tyrosine-type recombinase/integrase [Pirellula sp.]